MTGQAWLYALGVSIGISSPAQAQAWVPAQGEGTLAVTYQNYYVIGHYDKFGHENLNGATHTKSLIAEIDYGLTERIAVVIALPFIASKYTGADTFFVGRFETHRGPLDDRMYHAPRWCRRPSSLLLWWRRASRRQPARDRRRHLRRRLRASW